MTSARLVRDRHFECPLRERERVIMRLAAKYLGIGANLASQINDRHDDRDPARDLRNQRPILQRRFRNAPQSTLAFSLKG